ncbi:hypothetical protein KSF_105440 [Reticulibacter mediterranei]|uniref:Uncharacterized protein n=1 Tax=Reticulibacter mediterranei TaxID=2778369 RepID=A0A8J3ITJ3_9CHLR|nr:hypothetical protein KSF_105440 [Reticulibacter mediterranei]
MAVARQALHIMGGRVAIIAALPAIYNMSCSTFAVFTADSISSDNVATAAHRYHSTLPVIHKG